MTEEALPTPELNLGPQPIAELLQRHALSPTDLVHSSEEQLTHKMVARAIKGRKLTRNVMGKLVRAFNRASNSSYQQTDLFNYEPKL